MHIIKSEMGEKISSIGSKCIKSEIVIMDILWFESGQHVYLTISIL